MIPEELKSLYKLAFTKWEYLKVTIIPPRILRVYFRDGRHDSTLISTVTDLWACPLILSCLYCLYVSLLFSLSPCKNKLQNQCRRYHQLVIQHPFLFFSLPKRIAIFFIQSLLNIMFFHVVVGIMTILSQYLACLLEPILSLEHPYSICPTKWKIKVYFQ